MSDPRITVASMSQNRNQSGGGAAFAILLFIAILWWLRWFILAAIVITVVVIVTRWALHTYAQHRAAEWARVAAIRHRAEIENAQVLRGDPAGFFGHYPPPDRELIPRWYR